jgi:hypothetical protein
MPKKIRELKRMLLKAGFELLPGRGKGSHCVYKHPLLENGLDAMEELIYVAEMEGESLPPIPELATA